MLTSKAGTFNKRGFTLVELSMVLFIISLFALFSLPRLTSFFSTEKLQNDAGRLADYIEHLRDEAVFSKRHLLLVCNIEEGRFRVVSADRADTEEIEEVMMRPFIMEEAIKIVDIDKRGSGKRSDGEARINFYPGGRAETAFIHLKDSDGQALTLEISPLSRTVTIHEGYADVI